MRILFSCLLIIGLMAACTGPASAAPRVRTIAEYVPCKTVPTDTNCMDLVEVGKVKAVLKSTQIQLENGAVFILDGIRVPLPYDRMARDKLEELVMGKTVGLYANKTLPQEGQADEHGNEIVHVVLEDGTWVEQALVSAGLAWVDSSPTNRDLIETLYKYEIPARAKKVGFWSSPEYKVHNEGNMPGTVGKFVIFEGTPKYFKYNNGWAFYAFGFEHDNQHRALTVAVKMQDSWMFKDFSSDPVRRPFDFSWLAHSRMRVRGWVDGMPAGSWAGTPYIHLTHPEQMELPDGIPKTF